MVCGVPVRGEGPAQLNCIRTYKIRGQVSIKTGNRKRKLNDKVTAFCPIIKYKTTIHLILLAHMKQL